MEAPLRDLSHPEATRDQACGQCGYMRETGTQCPNCGHRTCSRAELIFSATLFICVGLPCLVIGPPIWLAMRKPGLDFVGMLLVGILLFCQMAATLKRTD